MATLLVREGLEGVDFITDSPEDSNFFHSNLKYLGIKVTPGSHVDQVVRSLVSKYKDRSAHGIFAHRWMLFIMKPLVWFKLPFEFVGLID